MSLERRVIEFIQGLTLHQGRFAGQPFKLHPWQKRFVRGMLGTEGDAGLSVARGAGKSTFCSALALCYLDTDGPLVQPNSEILCVGSAFDQAKIIFQSVLHFLGDQVKDKTKWRLQDSTNRSILTNRENGVVLRCIGSDPKRAHGRFPAVTFADELAQWPMGTMPAMLFVLQTASGKIPGARIIYLGTRADAPEHDWERLLNGGLEYAQIHAAGETDPPFQRRTWKKANPGIDYLPDLEAAIRRESKRAKQDPAAMASFKALRLNQGVSDTVENVLLGADTWRRIEVDTPPIGSRYVLGIDLGQTAAMSAAAAYWIDTGGLDAFGLFPESPHLLDRGRADGVDRLYVECWKRGS